MELNHFTAQLGDAQNVHVASYNSGSNDFVVLAYGDATATHLVEFEISNDGDTATELTSVIDPTTRLSALSSRSATDCSRWNTRSRRSQRQ